MNKKLDEVVKKIEPLDVKMLEKIRSYHNTLLMPLGALTIPLSYVEKIAAIQNRIRVEPLLKKQVVLFAADHGIAEEGVSAYPQEVTQQMLGSFANNWAVITSLAKQQKLDVVVLDVGVKGEPIKGKNIRNKKIAQGTKNFLQKSAMTQKEMEKAVSIGIQMAKETKEKNYNIAIIGEMGIGNTTSASALTASLLGLPVSDVTGHGTGVGDKVYQKKITLIKKALQNRRIEKNEPLQVLEKVGGFEIAAMVGFLLEASAAKLPVLLDGFITGAAALVAYRIAPLAREYWFAGHVSKEKGHKKILQELQLVPLLDLDMRLGEGSGAAFALPVLEQAIAVSLFTATFEKASVSNKE